MTKKNFWIQTGAAIVINIAILFMARLVSVLFAAENLIVAAVIIAAGYITASVFMVRWTRKSLHFPLTTLIFQFILSLMLVLSLYSEVSDALSSEDGFVVFLGIIILMLFVVVIIVLPILMAIVFIITLIPSLIANHIFKKAQNTAEVIPVEENINNNVYELKGSTENDQADT